MHCSKRHCTPVMSLSLCRPWLAEMGLQQWYSCLSDPYCFPSTCLVSGIQAHVSLQDRWETACRNRENALKQAKLWGELNLLETHTESRTGQGKASLGANQCNFFLVRAYKNLNTTKEALTSHLHLRSRWSAFQAINLRPVTSALSIIK